MMHTIRKLVDAAELRAKRIVRRGIVKAATAAGFVQVQGGDGELFDGAELWQQFGFSSRPAAGSEMLVLLVDGNADQAVAIAGTSRGDRPSGLAAGDAMLWATKGGSGQAQAHAKADGNLDLNCATSAYVNVGGATGAEKMLLGETVQADILTFANAVAGAVDLAAVKLAAGTLATEVAGWLCTKARGA